jgi:hypothetical protein
VWNVITREEVPNLYVMDSSIFSTSVGANPMQSIYTFGKIFAARLIHAIDEKRHMVLHVAPQAHAERVAGGRVADLNILRVGTRVCSIRPRASARSRRPSALRPETMYSALRLDSNRRPSQKSKQAARGRYLGEQHMGEGLPNAGVSSGNPGTPDHSRGEPAEPATGPADATTEPVEPHRVAEPSPLAVAAARGMPESTTLSEVSTLLGEFRALLGHLVSAQTPGAQRVGAQIGLADQEGRPSASLSGGHLDLLTRSPGEIASNGTLLRQLYSSVDVLSGLAAPATASSIYLTSAFLGDRRSSDAPATAKSAAQRMRLWAITTVLVALLFFIATIILLIHIDRGRRDIEHLEHAKDQYQLVVSAIDQIHDPKLPADCVRGLPEPEASRLRPGGEHQALCERFTDALRKISHRPHRGAVVEYRVGPRIHLGALAVARRT